MQYLTDEHRQQRYWNIPIANTTTVLLGTGTSITQAAMRDLAKAGVPVGFCGGGGTPLFTANEKDFEVAWFSPQSEYRPTEYLQAWLSWWFDQPSRLRAAKHLQAIRLQRIRKSWCDRRWKGVGFLVPEPALDELISESAARQAMAPDTMTLLTEEARLSKRLFKCASQAVKYGQFTRAKRGSGVDPANRFLDHGNYLAYGLAATATWVLGLPHGLAVLHGKTRRGGLVFDVADLVKDAVILPQAFVSATAGDSEQDFRRACIEALTRTEALDFMIESVKRISEQAGRAE